MADIGNENGDLLPPSDNALLNTGRPNAQIHSASWGSTFNFYTSRARNFDQFMFEVSERVMLHFFLSVVVGSNEYIMLTLFLFLLYVVRMMSS